MTATQTLQEQIHILNDQMAALKEFKGMMKELEDDLPMELEDLMISLKDLKKQVKERKEAHLKQIMEDNVEYNEYRERVQLAKEAIAEAKLKIFTEAANQSREHGDLDQTVLVEGSPFRVQTQKEVQVYLNGKVIK
jgi:Sec-independent protein translocase protein TatA